MSRLLFAVVLLLSAVRGWAACVESPSGQFTCDGKFVASSTANEVKFYAQAGPTPTGTPAAAADIAQFKNVAGTPVARVNDTGRVILGPGGTAANTCPFKLTTQAAGLTSVEQGCFELIDNSLHFTNLAVRRSVVQGQEVLTSDVTVGNTTTETEVYSQPHGAGYLTVGKMEDIYLLGTISSNSGVGSNTLTVRVKYAGATQATFVVPEAARSAVEIEIHILLTVRAIGAGTTSIQIHSSAEVADSVSDPHVNVLATNLDSTTAQATTVTFQWSDAAAGNTVTLLQGRSLSIDNNQ